MACDQHSPLARVAIWIVTAQVLLGFVAFLLCFPPLSCLTTPLSLLAPYAHLPLTRLHEVYADAGARGEKMSGHRDSSFDWTQPMPHWLYHLAERGAQFLEIDLSARIIPPPLHLMHVLQGAARMQVLRTVVLLGVPDLLADRVLSLSDLFSEVRAPTHVANQAQTMREGLLLGKDEPLPSLAQLPLGKLERLMHYAITYGYFTEVGYVGSHLYVNNPQSAVLRKDHSNNMNHLLFHFCNEAFLAHHRLFEAVLAPEDAGSLPEGAELFGGLALDATFEGDRATPRAKQALVEHERVKAQHLEKLKGHLGKEIPEQPQEAQHPTAWKRALNETMWDFYQSRPSLQRNFQQAMSEIDGNVNRALLADYPWDTLTTSSPSGGTTRQVVDTLVDVGGAEGAFLARLLAANVRVRRGVLFDLTTNVQAARALWTKQAQTVRGELTRTRQIELIAGDFFQRETIPLPSSSNSPTKYVLRQILHDWSDSATLRILHHFRERLRGYTAVALVLVEVNRPASEGFLLGERRAPGDYQIARPSGMRSLIDGQMLVCCNARERAPEQWRSLLEITGWKLVEQVQTRSVFSVMELQMADATSDIQTKPTAESTQNEEL